MNGSPAAGPPPRGAPGSARPCPLCGTPAPADRRCGGCGLAPGFGPGAPNPLRATALWAMAGAVIAVYLVTLGAVALIR